MLRWCRDIGETFETWSHDISIDVATLSGSLAFETYSLHFFSHFLSAFPIPACEYKSRNVEEPQFIHEKLHFKIFFFDLIK